MISNIHTEYQMSRKGLKRPWLDRTQQKICALENLWRLLHSDYHYHDCLHAMRGGGSSAQL